jgi:hypothetical protein
VTSLNLNLLLGSYSQGLLVQRAQVSRCQPAGQPTAEEIHLGQLNQEEPINRVEPVSLDESDSHSILPEKKKSVLERFQSSLEDRISQSKKFDHVAASVKLEELVSEASNISETMGQAKANEFMNKVLLATENGASPDSIDLAIESFFAEAAQTNPTAYQKLSEAKKTFSEIYESGQEPKGNQNQVTPGLSTKDQMATSRQSVLYNNYVSGRLPSSSPKPSFLNSLGNLFRAVA